jgi:predicted small lipoprotein YifL
MMMSPPFRLTRAVLFVLLCTGLLSACGKRGALDPPPGSEQAKQAETGQNSGSISPTGGGKRVPILPPKRDLPIDVLLD